MRESSFQSELIKELEETFPDSIILKTDPSYIQGFPDLLILFGDRWGALETKASKSSPKRSNQDWYVASMNEMSFARFIYPENKEHILDELQQAFRINRISRLLRT